MTKKVEIAVEGNILSNPTLDLAIKSLNRLCVDTPHTVSVAWDDDSEFIITSGGKNNLVTLVYYNTLRDIEATLLNPDPKGIEYEMIIGNQKVPIGDYILVPIEIAEKVFERFYKGQDIFADADLKWDIQPM